MVHRLIRHFLNCFASFITYKLWIDFEKHTKELLHFAHSSLDSMMYVGINASFPWAVQQKKEAVNNKSEVLGNAIFLPNSPLRIDNTLTKKMILFGWLVRRLVGTIGNGEETAQAKHTAPIMSPYNAW